MLYACQDRYGDMFTIAVAYEGTWVMLADPAAIKQVFTGDPQVFHAGEGNEILAPLLGRNSLLVLDEKRAHEPAQAAAAALPRRAHAGLRADDGRDRRARDRELADRHPLQAAAADAGADPGDHPAHGLRRRQGRAELADLRGALREFLDITTNPRFLFPLLAVGPKRVRGFGPFRRRIDRVDELIYREIAERRRAGDIEERDDVLSMMVGARHEDGSPMSDEEMRDELLTLLVAGHETTATSLSWAVERLVRHPEKLERLRAEVIEGGEEYLTATIQETLRLRPVISIVLRRLTEPVEIGGYELPAGVSVAPCIYLVHRNPEIYPEPRALPARALPREPARHLHLDPLRRRRPPLPRRLLRPVRDGGGPEGAGQAPPDPPGQPKARAGLPPRDHRDPAPRRRGHPSSCILNGSTDAREASGHAAGERPREPSWR